MVARKPKPRRKPAITAAQKKAAEGLRAAIARDALGRFGQGNKFWEARSSAGPKPIFAGPEQLWSACVEYFDWCAENPLWEDKVVQCLGRPTHEPVAKMRAMTIAGLCLFLDISVVTWREWKESRPDLSGVIARAEAVIYQQKFSGAAADMLNANIIARDLGLADKAELSGPNGGPIKTEEVSARERVARRIAGLTSGG